MERRQVEAGPLRVFRLFAGLQFGVLLVAALGLSTHSITYHSSSQIIFMVTVATALFGYFLCPGLDRHLGEAYLPIAIGIALCAPLFGQALLTLEERTFPVYLSVSDEMALFSLFPLLAAAWKYSFKVVAALAVGVGVVDLVLTVLTYPVEAEGVEYGRAVFTRTLGYLAIGFVLTHLMRQQQAQHRALEQANANLTHYAATLEQLAVSRERGRLARELHDTLAHTLSGLAVQLEGVRALWEVEPRDAHAMLVHALAATRDGLSETRRALGDLRAGPLEEAGLRAALYQCASTAALRCGAALDLDLPDELPELTPDAEQGLFRIAQEALENVVSHAGARRLRVRLRHGERHLTLSVSDDGCGFEPHCVDEHRHFGLVGLRERARLIGAQLEVVSVPGEGTTITLTLPAPPPGNAG